MFRKLTAIEPVSWRTGRRKSFIPMQKKLYYTEISLKMMRRSIRRIGDSDAVLVSYTTRIGRM
ncbi:MAG: hypothetical protein ACLVG5_02660 [Clostridium sp.]